MLSHRAGCSAQTGFRAARRRSARRAEAGTGGRLRSRLDAHRDLPADLNQPPARTDSRRARTKSSGMLAQQRQRSGTARPWSTVTTSTMPVSLWRTASPAEARPETTASRALRLMGAHTHTR
jgi:hypothetical protein